MLDYVVPQPVKVFLKAEHIWMAPPKSFAKRMGHDIIIICDDGTWWRTISTTRGTSYHKLRSPSYDPSAEPSELASQHVDQILRGQPSGVTKQRKYWKSMQWPCYRWNGKPSSQPYRDGYVCFWMRYKKRLPSSSPISFKQSSDRTTREWSIGDLTVTIKNENYADMFWGLS